MLYLTNYSEAGRYAIDDSFKSQFRDLKLKDFTPGFIEAEFRSALPQSFAVSNPYIFKFSKDEASFVYLGTFHILPLNVLPKSVINMLLSKNCLFIESFSNDGVEEGDFIENNQLTPLIPSSEPEEWFLNLPIKFQQFLDIVLSRDGLPNCYLYPLDAIQDKLAYLHLQGYNNCMDQDIVDSKDWLCIEALEICAESENLDPSTTDADLEYSLLKDLSALSDAGKYSNSYFAGTHGIKTSTEANNDPLLQERNIKWTAQIKTLMAQYQEILSDNLVIAAGFNHLFHENGLLQLFAQDEWKIERVDLAGDWHEINVTDDGYIA